MQKDSRTSKNNENYLVDSNTQKLDILLIEKNVQAYKDREFAVHWDRIRQEIHGFPSMPYIILTQPCPGSNLFEPSPFGIDHYWLELRRMQFERDQKPFHLLTQKNKGERKVGLFELDVSPLFHLNYTARLIQDVNGVTGDFYYFVCLDDYRLTDKNKKALICATSSEDKARILHQIAEELR